MSSVLLKNTILYYFKITRIIHLEGLSWLGFWLKYQPYSLIYILNLVYDYLINTVWLPKAITTNILAKTRKSYTNIAMNGIRNSDLLYIELIVSVDKNI